MAGGFKLVVPFKPNQSMILGFSIEPIVKSPYVDYGISTESLGQIYTQEQKRTQSDNEEFPSEAVGKGNL